MNILLCTIAYRKKLLERALGVARELGFDGVEVWGREPHVPERFDENRMRGTIKLLEQAQVKPFVFGSYLRFGSTRNDLDIQLSDVLHVARWLKTPLVRVWASDVGSEDASEEVWTKTVDEAREACERAGKLGMTLAVEMHSGTLADTADGAQRLVEEVGRDNFRLNFQIASERDGQSPEERLEQVRPWVVHVHAQNYAELPSDGNGKLQRVPLASGVANYPRLLGMLKDAGYDQNVAIEFACDEGEGKAESLAHDLQFLRAIC